jgi:hypothetical protein
MNLRSIVCRLVVAGALVSCGCKHARQNEEASRPIPTSTVGSTEAGSSDLALCEEGAKTALGPSAVVLRCGDVSASAGLEVLACVKAKGFKASELGIPVSQFAVFRRNKSRWEMELLADDKPLRNSEGYLVDDIDDSSAAGPYRVSIESSGPAPNAPIALILRYIEPNGETDEWPTEVEWNPSNGRFQQYSEGFVPPGFRSENKHPRHFRSRPL